MGPGRVCRSHAEGFAAYHQVPRCQRQSVRTREIIQRRHRKRIQEVQEELHVRRVYGEGAMKRSLWAVLVGALACVPALFGAYAYYYSDDLSNLNMANWTAVDGTFAIF